MERQDIHESYVSLETAKLLKYAGFNWPVYSYYCMDELMEKYKQLCFYSQGGDIGHNDCNNFYTGYLKDKLLSAPSLAVAQKWLREVRHLHVDALPENDEFTDWLYCIYTSDYTKNEGAVSGYHSYEEALDAGIKHALGTLRTVKVQQVLEIDRNVYDKIRNKMKYNKLTKIFIKAA